MSLKFNQTKINKMEKDYSNLEVSKELRKLNEAAGDLLGRYFPISPMALRGFINFSVRDAQVSTKMTLLEAASKGRIYLDKFNYEVLEALKEKLHNILEFQAPEQISKLDQIFRSGMKELSTHFDKLIKA